LLSELVGRAAPPEVHQLLAGLGQMELRQLLSGLAENYMQCLVMAAAADQMPRKWAEQMATQTQKPQLTAALVTLIFWAKDMPAAAVPLFIEGQILRPLTATMAHYFLAAAAVETA
jgi:hypothetical protein